MKDYDETLKSIIEKGDKLIDKRKKRAAFIRRVTFSVSGICAAVIIGVGIWHSDFARSGMKETFSRPDIVTQAPPVSVTTEASVQTTSDVRTSLTASSAETTSTSASETSAGTSPTTLTSQTTSSSAVSSSASASSTSTTTSSETKTSTTASAVNTATVSSLSATRTTSASKTSSSTVTSTTENQSASVTTSSSTATMTLTVTSAPNDLIIQYPSSNMAPPDISGNGEQQDYRLIAERCDRFGLKTAGEDSVYISYDYGSVKESSLNVLITEYDFNITTYTNRKFVYTKEHAKVYSIRNEPESLFIVLKFDCDERYFLFRNINCKPETT